jgi:hypothetical protein
MVKLELSEQMVAVIGASLGNAPYRDSAPVIAEMQRQIDAQNPNRATNGPAGMPPFVSTERPKNANQHNTK